VDRVPVTETRYTTLFKASVFNVDHVAAYSCISLNFAYRNITDAVSPSWH